MLDLAAEMQSTTYGHNCSTTQTTSYALYNTITTCNSNSGRDTYNATLHMTLQRLSLHKDAGYSMELCNTHQLTDAPCVRQHYTHSYHHEVHISCIVACHTDFTYIGFSGRNAIHKGHNCSTTCKSNLGMDN